MREIKFRAWIKSYKMIVEVQRINFDTRTIEVKIGEGDLYEFDFEEIKLIQYTGLKDKNSKKIYEGDILRVTDLDDEVNALNSDTEIGVVEWLDKWGFWNISNIENGLGDILNCGYVEVIGNIHENPELLEELDG